MAAFSSCMHVAPFHQALLRAIMQNMPLMLDFFSMLVTLAPMLASDTSMTC